MDISGLSSSSSASAPQSGTGAQNPSASLSQFKAQQSGQLLSLLPAPPSGPGIGLNMDIYAAVGMQAQGYLTGGLMSIELANISLGIDMSKPSRSSAASDGTAATPGTDAAAAGANGSDPASPAPAATTSASASHTNVILDRILKEDGYQAPAADPYSVQTDFFASAAGSPGGAASSSPSQDATIPYYANPGLSNPGLGGLLDSLG